MEPCTAGICSAGVCSCNACSCAPLNSRCTQNVQELAHDSVVSAGRCLACILCKSASSTAPFLSLSSISNTVPTMLSAWDSISIRSSWRPPSSENTPPAPHSLCSYEHLSFVRLSGHHPRGWGKHSNQCRRPNTCAQVWPGTECWTMQERSRVHSKGLRQTGGTRYQTQHAGDLLAGVAL